MVAMERRCVGSCARQHHGSKASFLIPRARAHTPLECMQAGAMGVLRECCACRGEATGCEEGVLLEAAEALKERCAVAAESAEEFARLSAGPPQGCSGGSGGSGVSNGGPGGGPAEQGGAGAQRLPATYTLPDGRTLTLAAHEGYKVWGQGWGWGGGVCVEEASRVWACGHARCMGSLVSDIGSEGSLGRHTNGPGLAGVWWVCMCVYLYKCVCVYARAECAFVACPCSTQLTRGLCSL